MFTLFGFLWNTLTSIWNAIVGFAQFLINTITSLLSLVAHLPAYLSMITSSLAVLPTIIIPFALAGVAVFAVLFVLGR